MGKLNKLSIAELQEELIRKQEHLESLMGERDDLRSALVNVENEISQLLGEAIEEPEAKAEPPATPAKGKAKKAGAKRGGKRGPKKGGAKKNGRKGRAGRKPTIVVAIKEIMTESGQPMRAGEVADALRQRKFPTKSKDLDNVVREAISRIPEAKRVARGLYQIPK